ncbi:MAG TPA: hypothetical protein VGQ58_07300 [Candidatus Limnocylindrales bacterium]|jgi:hypothetical protein|nr:hypothetical protein [Candidatus Limnocylindrales bacterium]
MSWNIALAVVLSVAVGGWMVFDGVRALVLGEYLTPSSGRYAGQLGPWAGLVMRIGIEPRSTVMKAAFVGFGVAWLMVAAGLVFGTAGVLQIALVLAIATIWYVPIGSAIALAVLVLVGAELLG